MPTTEQESTPGPPSPPPTVSAAHGAGLAITNLIKLGGLVVVLNEALIRSELRPGVLAISAFMMAGAQFTETILDRIFGK